MVSLKDRKARATEAIVSLGFGAGGTSAHVLKYTGDLKHYKASRRIAAATHELESIEFGFSGMHLGGASGATLFCKECDDGGQDKRWCAHLAAVIRGHYDAVPIYTDQPMEIAVPLIPTARCWKKVELKSRSVLDVDADDDEEDDYNDQGFPYEAWIVRKTRSGDIEKTYLGMFNQFDGLSQLRKLAFEWIEIADFNHEKLFMTCRECKKVGPSCTGTDRVLIGLESVCGQCIADMAARLAKANEEKRRTQDALSRFQSDPDLIPSAIAESAQSTGFVHDRQRLAKRSVDRADPQTWGSAVEKGW